MRTSAMLVLVLVCGCSTQLRPAPRGDAGVIGDARVASDAGPIAVRVDAAAAVDASAPVVVDAAPAVTCTPTAGACSTALYDRARQYAAAHPLRDGASWSGWCGSLMYRFGGFSVSPSSAIIAYRNSTIVSTDSTAAPVGAFHYWNYRDLGHVGVDLLGGGSVVFMASSHLGDSWGNAIGVTSVGAYGGSYLGWSMEYNGHGQRIADGGDCGPVAVPSGCVLPASPTATSGVPDHAFTMRLQMWAAGYGYTGALDGQMSAATWAGVQRGLGSHGYTGPDNGLPGQNTFAAFQRLAAEHGYTGPVNGVLGPNSYRGFASFLNGL